MFKIIFSNDKEIVFEDIIRLTSKQEREILSFARSYTQKKLVDNKSGLKIELNDNQKNIIIETKDKILQGKSPNELNERKIIQFTKHSIERLIKRFKGDLLDIYFSVIEMIQKSADLNDYAEWKGYKSLAYTLLYSSEDTSNKIVIFFIKQSNRNIKVITAMNDVNIERMDFQIGHDAELSAKLINLKDRLKDRYNQK